MKTSFKTHIAAAASLALLATSASHAVAVLEDFEGSTAGSATPPVGWSLITMAGSPT